MALTEFLANEEEKVRLIPKQLASFVEIQLTETETIYMFRIDGTLVSQYSDEAEDIIERNENYQLICQEIQKNSEFTADATTQTSNPTLLNSTIQTDPIIMEDTSCWSSSWDLYDSFNDLEENPSEDQTTNNMNGRLLLSLNLMECLLSLNLNQKVLVAYRKSAHEEFRETSKQQAAPKLTALWSLTSPLVDQKSVTCLTWNIANLNLLCVGYGDNEFGLETPGLICCWSLKNLLHPQRHLNCPTSVVSVDFSHVKPNILACGLNDGTVMIWDILLPKGRVIWSSREQQLHHFGPVWSLKWAKLAGIRTLIKSESMEAEEEVLLTVSEDGKACKWIFNDQKCTKKDLLHLKTPRSQYKVHKISIIETIMARVPLCAIDFTGLTTENYLIGSGLGTIHLCSTFFEDKCVKIYNGHEGPIYKICISPKDPEVFLTCSADWTIKLWNWNQNECLLCLQTSAMQPVYDVTWAPFASSIFASVSPSRLDIWDLSLNFLDPIITEKAGRKEALTTALFSGNSKSLFVGNADGKVKVYLLTGLNNEEGILKEIMNELATYKDFLPELNN